MHIRTALEAILMIMDDSLPLPLLPVNINLTYTQANRNRYVINSVVTTDY